MVEPDAAALADGPLGAFSNGCGKDDWQGNHAAQGNAAKQVKGGLVHGGDQRLEKTPQSLGPAKRVLAGR